MGNRVRFSWGRAAESGWTWVTRQVIAHLQTSVSSSEVWVCQPCPVAIEDTGEGQAQP